MAIYACDWCWGHRKGSGSGSGKEQELRIIEGNQAVCEACYNICVKEDHSPEWVDLPKPGEFVPTKQDS
jgi:hypothetical protein